MDFFEALLQKPSLFKEENKLDINYIPDFLPHREKELSLLSQLFLTLITNPNLMSRKILITGKTGVGKRQATIIKHRSRPEGKKASFAITSTGLE